MIRCQTCGRENLESSQYCDECGTRLRNQENAPLKTQASDVPVFQSANVTSVGIPAMLSDLNDLENSFEKNEKTAAKGVHATLVIERGTAVGKEFFLTSDESVIGRWDADNGIFPDVDLDAFDAEAKVSRRHARIIRDNNKYSIEDLGSTNGTYVNRGRRLIPGSPQRLEDGDEIIVGKTFLRFNVNE